MKKITVFTDGAARGNPGLAGAGAYVVDEDGNALQEAEKFLGEKTNNYAEYAAVILGLETVKKLYGKKLSEMKVEMKLDSELVTKQLNREYKVKEPTLFALFVEVNNFLVKDVPNVSFTHVRREHNKEADRLANEAIDNRS